MLLITVHIIISTDVFTGKYYHDIERHNVSHNLLLGIEIKLSPVRLVSQGDDLIR